MKSQSFKILPGLWKRGQMKLLLLVVVACQEYAL